MTSFARRCATLLVLMAIATAASGQTTTVVPTGNGTFFVTPEAPVRDTAAGPQTGTGRLRGRVVDAESGAPLMDSLMRLSGGGLRESPTVGTDDDGRFEFENLPPGRYSLVANKPGYMTLSYGQRRPFENGRPIELAGNQTLEGVDFAVPRGGVIVAHVTDENGDPFAGVPINAQRFRFAGAQRTLVPVSSSFDTTDDRGEVRVFGLPPGEYYVSTMTLGGALAAASSGTSYVTTYYPGTAAVDTAEKVTVQVGKEVHVNIPLVAAKLARVSGVVRRADGSPAARTTVSVAPKVPFGGLFRSAQIQPDGTFTVTDVAPGEYQLQASFGTTVAERELGRTSITVAGRDLTGVTVAMSPGGTVRGRFVLEPQAPPDFRFASLQPIVSGSPSSPQPTQDDGSFAIQSVFDGGIVRVLSPPAGWFLKAVRLDGKDVTDVPITIESRRELTGVEIVLTQRRATIAGTAVDGKGAATGDYTVVLFPEDRAQWTPESRFIATARPDQQGRFRIMGMPDGKYLAAAVEYLEAGTERDPDLLGRLRERASPVTLVEGESSTVTLSLQ